MWFILLPLFPLVNAIEDEARQVEIGSTGFWSQIVAILCLVLISGIIAGLTLGLMSLDTTNLKILQLAGTRKQQYYASRILPIRKNGHILLTTLLLTNTVLNETLPILFDDIFRKGFMSVIVSTVLLVLFSEIIPQAVFSKHGLAIGSLFAFPVRILIGVWFIVGWPISKFLDWMLGSHEGFSYTEQELGALIQLHDITSSTHGCLDHDIVIMIQNILAMQERTLSDIVNPKHHLLLLASDTVLNTTLVDEYIQQKYTHISVCESKPMADENVIGILALNSLSNEDFTKSIGEMKLEPCVKLNSSTPLTQIVMEMTRKEQVVLVYRTEQEIEQAKQKAQPPEHLRVLSCRLKKFFGYLCHACSEQVPVEEEKDLSIASTIDVGFVGMVTSLDVLSYVGRKR